MMDNFLNWDLQDWIPDDQIEIEFVDDFPPVRIGDPDAYHMQPAAQNGWDNCDAEIRCIWADQLMTGAETLTGKMYVHRFGWYHGMVICQAENGTDAVVAYKETMSH